MARRWLVGVVIAAVVVVGAGGAVTAYVTGGGSDNTNAVPPAKQTVPSTNPPPSTNVFGATRWTATEEHAAIASITRSSRVAGFNPQCVLAVLELHYPSPDAYNAAALRNDPQERASVNEDLRSKCG